MRDDDQAAEFVAFTRAHRRDLMRTASLLCAGEEAHAEDLVQTTLTKLYLAWSRVRRADSPLAYARRSLTHLFIDEARRAHRRRESTSADPAGTLPSDPLDPRTPRAAGAPKLVVFSWLDEPHRVDAAHACGADAQISKTLSTEDLVDSLECIPPRRTLRGTHHRALFLRPRRLAGRRPGPVRTRVRDPHVRLPGAEQHEVCQRAHLGLNTVKTYIRSAYRKIGVATRPQAVIWAFSHGLAPLTGPRL